MRFKNRYLLMELVWRDGKTASQFSKCSSHSRSAGMHPVQHCIMCHHDWMARHPASLLPADEAALFGVMQKAMQLQFGDYGAAMASASLSGEKQADAGPMSVLAGGITLP